MSDPRQHEVYSERVPIDSTGTVFETSIEVFRLTGINIEGESTADYALDLSPDGETEINVSGDTYFEGVETYSGTSIRDTFELPDRHLRVRVTSAGTAGDEAVITIQGKR